jgi:hypothetical protein
MTEGEHLLYLLSAIQCPLSEIWNCCQMNRIYRSDQLRTMGISLETQRIVQNELV